MGLCVLRFGSGSDIMFWWNILIIIKNAHFASMLYAVCRVAGYIIIIILNARSFKWH